MEFQLLESINDKNNLFQHRRKVYESSGLQHLIPNEELAHCTDYLDDKSLIFSLKKTKELVASCRVTGMHDMDKAFQNKAQALDPHIDFETTFFISRICIQPNYQGQKIYQYLLKQLALWLMQNTLYISYIAQCKTELVSLYTNIGSKILTNSQFYDEVAKAEYQMIKGNIFTANDYCS